MVSDITVAKSRRLSAVTLLFLLCEMLQCSKTHNAARFCCAQKLNLLSREIAQPEKNHNKKSRQKQIKGSCWVNFSIELMLFKKRAIKKNTFPSYEYHWKGFIDWMKTNSNVNPEIVDDTTLNHIASYLTYHFEYLHHKSGTTCNIKSGLKHHYKLNLLLENGQTRDSTNNGYFGNPCDSIEVKELVTGSHNERK